MSKSNCQVGIPKGHVQVQLPYMTLLILSPGASLYLTAHWHGTKMALMIKENPVEGVLSPSVLLYCVSWQSPVTDDKIAFPSLGPGTSCSVRAQ